MARMASTRLGFQWHDYVQADAECDRYWAFKKAERRSLNEATKKSPRAATQGEKKTSEKSTSTFSLPRIGYFVKENGGNYDEKCFKQHQSA